MEKIFDKSMKAHSRVIWNCCWLSSETFVTVGRDKQLITWKLSDEEKWEKSSSFTSDQALTAVDCVKLNDSEESLLLLGKEDGTLELYKSDKGELKLGKRRVTKCPADSSLISETTVTKDNGHSGFVSQVRFRDSSMVATCGDDHQVKLFSLKY